MRNINHAMCSDMKQNCLLPHHEQKPLCINRLAYRQGRKLTAVKVYTISNESNHLLIFGVPTLNLRQETKALLSKFGKLIQCVVSKNHDGEEFTETYHATFQKIQSARLAKKMLDTKNFYGGSLHICYAPEFESIEETRAKLMQRHADVTFRLQKLDQESECCDKKATDQLNDLTTESDTNVSPAKLNMGEYNVINLAGKHNAAKRSIKEKNVVSKKNKSLVTKVTSENIIKDDSIEINMDVTPAKLNMDDYNVIDLADKREIVKRKRFMKQGKVVNKKPVIKNVIESDRIKINNFGQEVSIEVVDCTSTNKEIISNINEALNYKQFGNEDIRRIPQKAANIIKFNFAYNATSHTGGNIKDRAFK